MNPQALDVARAFCLGLLSVLGEAGEVEAAWEGEGAYVNLRGGLRLLAGDAAFRLSLSRLVRLHIKAHCGQDVPVIVDINGVVLAHRAELARRARDIASQVATERRRVELPPMPADDRRVVHLTLAGIPGVRTLSVGREGTRRVVIEPVENEEKKDSV